MSILHMINLNTFSIDFRIHKNQVGLMKLKGFSPLGVKIQQFLFMKKFTFIKQFFSLVANTAVVPNAIGFAR